MSLDRSLLHEVEYVEARPSSMQRSNLHVAAYNIERGLRLDAIVAQWKQHCAGSNDILLISEADRGMARSGNRHIAREFAEALGFSWAYGIEFFELTKGNRRERRTPGENEEGYIGNAILSRYPLTNLEVVRLPCAFDYSKRYAARIGSRMAIVGDLRLGHCPMTVASVHLESDSSPRERSEQMAVLLNAVRARDRGQPIVIAGDMNTTGLDVNALFRSVLRRPWMVVSSPPMQALEEIEPMFSLLDAEGYQYRQCNVDRHTLKVWGYRAHLDWIFVKNLGPNCVRRPPCRVSPRPDPAPEPRTPPPTPHPQRHPLTERREVDLVDLPVVRPIR